MPALDSVPPPAVVPARAKPLRPATGSFPMARKPALRREDPIGFVRAQVTAMAFTAVLAEAGIANTHIADLWGVSESIVRGVKKGDKPLTLSKVQQLPEDLRAALDRKTLELLANIRALRASLPVMPDDLRAALPLNDHYRSR